MENLDGLILDLLEQEDRALVTNTKNKVTDRLKDLYSNFLRPKAGELLRVLNLDIHYRDGYQNYLNFEAPDGKMKKVLDLTGGYGANILGHKNPTIINTLMNSVNNLSPSNTQASLRRVSTLLGKEISNTIEEEIGSGPWVTTFSNSGTEAVEAALKICLLRWTQVREEYAIQNTFQYNYIKKLTETGTEKEISRVFDYLSNELKDSSEFKDIKNLAELNEHAYKQNMSALEESFVFIGLEGAFHGKSMGSLLMTHNPLFKEAFGLSHFRDLFVHLDSNDPKEFEEKIKNSDLTFLWINISDINVKLKKRKLNKVAGLFLEPIQGENGVVPLDDSFLQAARKICDEYSILLVSDEIQSGLYRTGHFAALHHHKIAADIYTFSKGLGGGVCKIAATVCHSKLYPVGFDYLHTSTFAEDDISSSVALKVMELLKRDKEKFYKIDLIGELTKLKEKYPRFIKEVRGRKFMASIEMTDQIGKSCHEFHIFDFPGYLGYFLASALLHNENIRTTPSLSAPRTLRVQPSLYFGKEEIELLINGFDSLFQSLEKMDMSYFFHHLYPGEVIKDTVVKSHELDPEEKTNRDLAVFFCHMITDDHAKKLVPSHAEIDSKIFSKKIAKITDVTDFTPLVKRELKTPSGKIVDVVFMAYPTTSASIVKAIKTNQANKIISKLQKGVEYVKEELGAKTIGLGQFTSIVSLNGLALDPMGMNITTGNAYTTSMTVKATLKAAEAKGIDLAKTDIACVGIAGNIVSTTASLMADHAGSMTFIYHTDLKDSPKYQKVLIDFFRTVVEDDAQSPFSLAVKEAAQSVGFDNEIETLFKLVDKLVNDKKLKLGNEIEYIKDSQIILTGASSSQPFVSPKIMTPNAVIVDIGVPPNVIKKELKERTDVLYIQGGLAKLPKVDGKEQIIKATGFPLRPGTSYACLAETIILTMNDVENIRNTGSLNKKMIKEVNKLAEQVGFDLEEFKSESSL